MKRLLIVITLCLATVSTLRAQYYSVNYDVKTVAAMAAAFATELGAESYYSSQVADILKHYTTAEVATAAIFASKYLERKAFTDIGIWSNATENYYYRRIYKMVSEKIIPKIWVVAGMMLRSPQNALYWGSYLVKICEEVKSLCMQFESVVTNSTLSFSDVAFLEIKEEIAAIFNLSEFADIDWHSLLDDLGKVKGNFTVDKLKADLDHLYTMGAGLATAGITNIGNALLNQNSFKDAMNGKVSAIKDIYDNYAELFEQLDGNIGETLLAMVGGKENVAGLFNLADYNITAWMTDYLSEAKGNYYTQRWYIARRESGSTTLCDYNPPTDDNSILSGGHWTRFETTNTDFYPNYTQREQVLANSERYAGWSRDQVNRLNAANDGFTYNIYYYMSGYSISRGGKQTKKAYAYSIEVEKSWNREEIEYEAYFDSYSMDLTTFKGQLNARLTELNENEDGYTYYIDSDARNYYSASDVEKLQGCETVTISVTCSDNVVLGEGSTQYKCRKCSGTLNSHTKECAMSTTVTDNELDASEIQDLVDEAKSKITSITNQITSLTTENARLLIQIENGNTILATTLRVKYAANKNKIEQLRGELSEWKSKLQEYEDALAQAENDDDIPTDDYYRIPAIMQDCKVAYDLRWQSAGSWSGYIFIRKATMPNVDGVITFKATLSIARKPVYFLGIKIHRAIVRIKWELTSDFTQSNVVKVLTLDPEMSDEEKQKYVNEQINEVARQYPRCKVTTEYVKSEPVKDDTGNDVIHLLWASDRLDIAREVDYRITSIYSNLVSLEKMMSYKRDILDVLKDVLPELDEDEGRRLNLVQESKKRWIDNAKNTKKK